MAIFSKSLDCFDDLTRITVKGELKAGELTNFAADHGHDQRTRLVLWDLRATSWSGISSKDLLRSMDATRKYSETGYRTAFVVANKVDYGLGRMLENYTEVLDFKGKYRPFFNLEEAEIWLRSNFSGLEQEFGLIEAA